MPDWSGMEVLEVLKRVCPQVPLIIATGPVGDKAGGESIRRGAADYVMKDHLERLPIAVERALREKDAKEEPRRAAENLKLLAAIVESCEDAIFSKTLDGPSLVGTAARRRCTGTRLRKLSGSRSPCWFRLNARASSGKSSRKFAAGSK